MSSKFSIWPQFRYHFFEIKLYIWSTRTIFLISAWAKCSRDVRTFCTFRTVAKFAVSDFNISFIAHESRHTWRINKTSWLFRVDLYKLYNIIKSIFQSSWMCIDSFNGKLYKSDSWSSWFRRRIYPRINRLRKYIWK